MADRQYTIITITFNNADGLHRTLDSVRKLRYRHFELIIIDGNSQDNTLEVLNDYTDIVTRIVSDNDNGIYDAMNKGISLAIGDYVVFMNAGDVFASPATLDEVNALEGDIILGSAIYGGELRHIPSQMSLYDVLSVGINHQSTYYRTEIIKTYPFDTSYIYIADLKSVVEPMAKHSIVPTCTDKILSVCEGNGMSQQHWRETKTERDRIVEEVIAPYYKADYRRMVRIDNSIIDTFAVLSQFRILFPLLRLLAKLARMYNSKIKKIPL
ncbi:MAG: glycosyltransferase [Prevotella sp.]|nr:glycosyltransferase [Prevotella sp.]